MEKKAVRNLRLCTKDCLCLYVCPTGATDTENSIIDVSRCVGCGDCAAACPSGAISMVPAVYPEQQEKKEEVCFALNALIEAKAEEEMTAASLARKTEKDGLRAHEGGNCFRQAVRGGSGQRGRVHAASGKSCSGSAEGAERQSSLRRLPIK